MKERRTLEKGLRSVIDDSHAYVINMTMSSVIAQCARFENKKEKRREEDPSLRFAFVCRDSLFRCSAAMVAVVRLRVSNARFSGIVYPAGSSRSARTGIRGGELILGTRNLAEAKHHRLGFPSLTNGRFITKLRQGRVRKEEERRRKERKKEIEGDW